MGIEGGLFSNNSLELLSKDILHQTEATTPLSPNDIPSVDTEIFLRSLSFEKEQNYVEEELHDEDTDETHFEDQTNVFTSEFTAELTSMVDETHMKKIILISQMRTLAWFFIQRDRTGRVFSQRWSHINRFCRRWNPTSR